MASIGMFESTARDAPTVRSTPIMANRLTEPPLFFEATLAAKPNATITPAKVTAMPSIPTIAGHILLHVKLVSTIIINASATMPATAPMMIVRPLPPPSCAALPTTRVRAPIIAPSTNKYPIALQISSTIILFVSKAIALKSIIMTPIATVITITAAASFKAPLPPSDICAARPSVSAITATMAPIRNTPSHPAQ